MIGGASLEDLGTQPSELLRPSSETVSLYP